MIISETSTGLWCVWHSVQNPFGLIVDTGVADEVDVVEKFVVVDEVVESCCDCFCSSTVATNPD